MSKRLFIGREEELKRLRNAFFFVQPDSYGHCYSLIGLNGIGKTALIRHLSEEFEANQPPNTFYFATIIEDGMTFWTFWSDMIEQFSEVISEEYISSIVPQPTLAQKNAIKKIREAYQFIGANVSDRTSDSFRSQLMKHLEVFKHYTKLGVRILITIDEFDRARTVFQTGQFFQRLYDLTPKGASTELNLSIITISRRRVSTIAHHMKDGSDLEAAYPPLVLKGFNDQELSVYFNSYQDFPCGKLSDESQKQVLYLCGRSPGLLMGLRDEIELMSGSNTDIGQDYVEHGLFIKQAYDHMIKLMRESFADQEQTKNLLDVFIQKFIGPAYDDSFEVEMPLLYAHGFVTQGTVDNNIFSRSGVPLQGWDNSRDGGVVYEPIAPYFVEYVKHMVIPHSLSDLSGMLIKAEKLIRDVIEKEMRSAYPETWEEIINRYAGKKDYYLETLQVKALQNDFSSSSISKLNVISFKEYYYIINDHWDLFSKYFIGYPNKNALCSAMSLLSESRNDSAHLNLVIYNGENRRKLREVCFAFISCLENYTDSEINSNCPTNEQIIELVNNSAIVTFCCQAIKMPKGNLRGIIKGSSYPAGVAQRNIAAFGFSRSPQVGDEFSATIERWDSNAQIFNLKAPENH